MATLNNNNNNNNENTALMRNGHAHAVGRRISCLALFWKVESMCIPYPAMSLLLIYSRCTHRNVHQEPVMLIFIAALHIQPIVSLQ